MPIAPVTLLLGPDSHDLVRAVLDEVGGRLTELRPVTVSVQPSGTAVVRYSACVERGDRHVRETFVATAGSRIPAGVAVLEGTINGESVRVGVWRWPNDPALPALRWAIDAEQLGRFLRAMGVDCQALPTVKVTGYRPGRRAVLQITSGESVLYCKVVRPTQVDTLRRRHELLAPHVPVPPVVAAADDGLIVLPALPGDGVRAVLTDDGPLPDAAALEALLDRFPPEVLDLPTRPGHVERVGHFAAILELTAMIDSTYRPQLSEVVGRLAEADLGEQPVVPVHGDFYEGQLLVDAGTVTGLLDVDTAGPGHRIDDWATLLAHLDVLNRPAARRWGADLLAQVERRYGQRELRPRIAAAVLGLATGPFRVQQRNWARHTAHRLDLAARWLTGNEKPFISISSSPHRADRT